MIRADRPRIEAIVKELMAMPKVAFVGVCVGNWDLHVGVLATDHAKLMEFVGPTVQAVEGVLGTDTLLLVGIMRYNPCLKRVTTLSSGT
jgi:DNA-binding Lrp family transcriptional regulator